MTLNHFVHKIKKLIQHLNVNKIKISALYTAVHDCHEENILHTIPCISITDKRSNVFYQYLIGILKYNFENYLRLRSVRQPMLHFT